MPPLNSKKGSTSRAATGGQVHQRDSFHATTGFQENTITWNTLAAVAKERLRQTQLIKDGAIPFDCSDPMPINGDANLIKLAILTEEVGEVAQEVYESTVYESDGRDTIAKLRTELIQVAAVAVAWAESLT